MIGWPCRVRKKVSKSLQRKRISSKFSASSCAATRADLSRSRNRRRTAGGSSFFGPFQSSGIVLTFGTRRVPSFREPRAGLPSRTLRRCPTSHPPRRPLPNPTRTAVSQQLPQPNPPKTPARPSPNTTTTRPAHALDPRSARPHPPCCPSLRCLSRRPERTPLPGAVNPILPLVTARPPAPTPPPRANLRPGPGRGTAIRSVPAALSRRE